MYHVRHCGIDRSRVLVVRRHYAVLTGSQRKDSNPGVGKVRLRARGVRLCAGSCGGVARSRTDVNRTACKGRAKLLRMTAQIDHRDGIRIACDNKQSVRRSG